ncbi:MAG: glycoside hydrolase family 9 protein, partial [Bacteroidota bacterium]
RYIVQKSTAATLDFAAVMAQASRILAEYENEFPGLADSTLAAARAAWTWARANPAMYYNQSAMNDAFNPDVWTGEYGDGNVNDEFDWAAMELFITTKEDSFLTVRNALSLKDSFFRIPGWPHVRSLGYYSTLHHADEVGYASELSAIRSQMISAANGLRSRAASSPYGISMSSGDFYWGSNSVAANQGMLLLQAYRETGDASYLNTALSALDYLLGRNATAYSFLTGHGSRSPMHPHHRQSEADNVTEPVPGLLAGGPNPGQQDGCAYPSALPARSYVDSWCSYASNEIAINWNAPFFYLAAAIEATFSESGMPVGTEGLPDRSAAPATVLIQNIAPHPVAAETTIRFRLGRPSGVTIDVFDLHGRRMASLMHDRPLGAGEHSVRFDASTVPSGVYFCRISTDGVTETRPLIVVR